MTYSVERELVNGVWETRVVEDTGGSGSTAGVFTAADVLLTEQTTGGVYSAEIPMAAGSLLWDVLLIDKSGAPWYQVDGFLDTQHLQIGDSGDASGFLSDTQCNNFRQNLATNGVTDNFPSETVGALLSTSDANKGNYSVQTLGQQSLWLKWYDAEDAVAVVLTTTIDAPPGDALGRLLVRALYFAPVTAITPDFA